MALIDNTNEVKSGEWVLQLRRYFRLMKECGPISSNFDKANRMMIYWERDFQLPIFVDLYLNS